ncbi:MAG: hypothetical protein U0228_16990 [Myxococcaceae bacterium]
MNVSVLRVASLSLVLALVTGCEAEIEQVQLAKDDIVPIDAAPLAAPQIATPEVALCEAGRAYTGFGGENLALDRRESDVGLERARTKPFSALVGEYPRVLGNTPDLLSQSESTFGLTAPRWFARNEPNAVSLYQAYRIAFQGCLTLTAQPAQYAALPTVGTATAECAAWAKKFWGRTAMGPEIEACANVIGQLSSKETQLRRRWAHGCASVLTSSDFLTF